MKTGMNAVVTGGGSGLGRALCFELVRRQGRVVVADVLAERADTVAKDIEKEFGPGLAFPFCCDVSDLVQVEELADFAAETLGQLDLVVNNAGVAAGGFIGEGLLEDWRWVSETNLWGVIHGCHIFLPRLKAQGHGAILNVSSAAGLLNPPQMGPYSVAKAGVLAFSETLFVEARPHKVQVTVLCPTFFDTALLENARGGEPESMAFVARLMKKGRLSPEDVAKAALKSVERGELYCLPHREGRLLWAAKRLAPQRFLSLVQRYEPLWRKAREKRS